MPKSWELFVLFLLSALISTTAYAAPLDEQPILPDERDYAAQEQSQDCSVMRAVIRHAESDYNDLDQQRQGYKMIVLQRRQELEACAQRASLSLARDARQMALVAEYCPAEYDAWLYSGAHYRMLREDDRDAQHDIRLLVTHATRKCLPLPENASELPPADGDAAPAPL